MFVKPSYLFFDIFLNPSTSNLPSNDAITLIWTKSKVSWPIWESTFLINDLSTLLALRLAHSQWRKRLIIATGTLPRVYDDTLSIYLPRLFVDVSLSLSFSSRLKVYIFRYNFYFVKWRIIVETSQLTSQLLLEIINREIALATCLVNSSENNFAEQPNTKVSWFGSYLCFSILFVNTVLTVIIQISDSRKTCFQITIRL